MSDVKEPIIVPVKSIATEALNCLGMTATDKVTGLKGVIDSVWFDLYGCIQVGLAGRVDDKGEITKGAFVDISRIEIDKNIEPVMPRPAYEELVEATVPPEHGSASKDRPSV